MCAAQIGEKRRVSILEPVPDSTKLHVNEEGLRLLRSMPGRLAPVVVIGPYRSGKSFLINQMLGMNCGALATTPLCPSVGLQEETPGRRTQRLLKHYKLCRVHGDSVCARPARPGDVA